MWLLIAVAVVASVAIIVAVLPIFRVALVLLLVDPFDDVLMAIM